MSASPERAFVDHCCELLSGVGPCTAKRLFGGWGIATDGLTLAIIADEALYLKANAETEAQWLAAGCQPFVYEAKGKPMRLRYYSAPDEAMDSPALMLPWARLALGAAVAAKKPTTRARTRTRKKPPLPPTP